MSLVPQSGGLSTLLNKGEFMHRKSINHTALAFILTGLLVLTGCHKKNRHDMAQDDQLEFTEEDMQQQSLGDYEDHDPSAQSTAEAMPHQTTPDTPVVSTHTPYTIRRGDTLWSIAKQHYNNGQRWKEIVSANPGLDPTRLKIGQQIVIP